MSRCRAGRSRDRGRSKRFAPEAFGSDAGDAETMLDTLQDRSAWPRFVVPLARRLRDRRARQQRRGVHHDGLLPHAFRLAQDLVLASDGEDRIGPGLCWPELAALLVAPPGAAGVTDSHAQLLLLLPVLGDAAVPEEAVTAVVEALVAQGAPEASEALARHLFRGHPGAPRTGGSTVTNRAGSARAITAPASAPR